MMTKEQCRGARAMLGISREDLAREAKVAYRTVVDFERGARAPYERTIADIERALVAQGVEFIAAEDGKGPGVRLTHSTDA
jgi:ribosome-binding protein aMBF1 (putative translation factor)